MDALWQVTGKRMHLGENVKEIEIMENDFNSKLENLYKVFKPYYISGNLRERSCECCVTNEEIKLLLSKQLKDLSEDDIGHFMRSAITTFGEISDYKHFLPRILELLSFQNSTIIDDFLTFEKLNYGEWETWNEDEIVVVKEYLESLWYIVINNEKSTYYQIENVLEIIAKYIGMKKALKIWEGSTADKSVEYIVDFVLNGLSMDVGKKNKQYFLKWLHSKKVLSMMENVYFKDIDFDFSKRLSITYTILERDYEE
ncbi:hypothetical protein LPB138_07200 [Urechidicola croceus]|uniref:Uncharacterized protein n=2 Tax=Urechidicola croceus TaxID=1850246 RepID=A0A1D8P7E1_9FLAO|nr:hypothetical protein LPB138_07200 [Urechidicola croceus]